MQIPCVRVGRSLNRGELRYEGEGSGHVPGVPDGGNLCSGAAVPLQQCHRGDRDGQECQDVANELHSTSQLPWNYLKASMKMGKYFIRLNFNLCILVSIVMALLLLCPVG